MAKEKYVAAEEFLEVTFELPNIYTKDNLAKEIMEHFKYAVNIKLIPCKMVREPVRLSVSKDDYSYTLYNNKDREQIVEEEK